MADRGELARLREVTDTLRVQCPWDARQTHRSLLPHLVEETCEVIDAVLAGSDAELREELGDLLLQVYFHARIAEDEGRFDLDDVAAGIADKLISRHTWVFGSEEVPDDLRVTWEQRKRAEKGRTSSLEGIAQSLSSLSRTQKVISRARAHAVAVELPDEPITAKEVGQQVQTLVARAQASGIDADVAVREALRDLEARIVEAES
ncbi:nucleoside triphosphate pyrophosphohydrolase [Arachnia propionica]|uniref:Nucleoside triphosphate pyrophosphohydrolase n=1 Tax=Arachnia propionica TaxID=1750 RepID=A0A3P1T853_9ACTN|nr:MazG family protein [Arachnia propionica]RRD05438.1 nucleoside triphosphate pyrophosphohydrolase [Arachnia propionica]